MTGRVIQGSFLSGQPKLAIVQPRTAPPPIQAKTTARPPGPPATAFAVRSPGPPAPAFSSRPPAVPAFPGQQGTVQRHGAGGAFAVEAGSLGLVSNGGRPLPEAVRGKMEAALGADFSSVRVHVGPQAGRIGAIAFTVGSDIYFAPGRYQPDTIQGQQLLGHELAHVVQQRAGRVRNPLGSDIAVVQDRALEAEADRLGQRAAAQRIVAQPKARAGALSRGPVAQRLAIVNWHGTAYQPNEAINDVFYQRVGSKGGNHFISDNWVNSIIIDIIHNLTRANALTILKGLTQRCDDPGIVPNPDPPQTQRGFDDFLSDAIGRVSNADDNRFFGAGYGDSKGEGIDKPYSTEEKDQVKTYGRTYVRAMKWGYQTAGKQIPAEVGKFLTLVRDYSRS